MSATIRKLILPVAGLGMRLRPLTRRTPKALLAVGGRPLLYYILEEAHASGVRDIFLVVSPQHTPHFTGYLAASKKRFRGMRFTMKIQTHAHGNGQAILECAKELGGEPFAVRYCDDLLFHAEPALQVLIRLYRRHRVPIFVVERVPWARRARYGIISIERSVAPSLYSVHSIFEKHIVGDTNARVRASNLAVVGAYVLTPRLLTHLAFLERLSPPIPDALLLTAALHHELARRGAIYGWEFPGTRLDCGTLAGLERAKAFLARKLPR